MTDETERNPLRAMMVANILKQNYTTELSVEALKGFFPDDFDLGEDDLAPHIVRAAEVEFEGEAPQAEPTPQRRPKNCHRELRQ